MLPGCNPIYPSGAAINFVFYIGNDKNDPGWGFSSTRVEGQVLKRGNFAKGVFTF